MEKKWLIIPGVAMGVLLIVGKARAAPIIPRVPQLERWRPLVEKYSEVFGLPPKLVYAIIMTESSGLPEVSRKENSYYSYGLMGMTWATAKGLDFTGDGSRLFDPDVNVFWGCKYLDYLKRKSWIKGDITKMIAGYNAGEDLSPWPSSYIERVESWMEKI